MFALTEQFTNFSGRMYILAVVTLAVLCLVMFIIDLIMIKILYKTVCNFIDNLLGHKRHKQIFLRFALFVICLNAFLRTFYLNIFRCANYIYSESMHIDGITIDNLKY